jgi:hypothetical protein
MKEKTFKFFATQTGNLGDTSALFPVLSGLYQKYNKKIELVVRLKMRNFKGFKELAENQDCIKSLKFEDNKFNRSEFTTLQLCNDYTSQLNRPYEVSRYEHYLKKHLKLEFSVDDDFTLKVPEGGEFIYDKYIVGDRTYTPNSDMRRKFDVLRDCGKFKHDKCHFLDYNRSLIENLQIIKNNDKPLITTFTGISVLSDLMKKETMVFYDETLDNWDGKPIESSFNQHFYRNRNSVLINLEEFLI